MSFVLTVFQLEDAPNPLCGTTKAVNYEYKLRPFREQWLELASHAVVCVCALCLLASVHDHLLVPGCSLEG
jgi:hypothetical protein